MKEKLLNLFRKHGVKLLIGVMFLAAAGAGDRYFEISKNLDIYATLYKEVNDLYVEEINSSRLMREGIDAMLESLDPYTDFIPESDVEDMRFRTTGQYGGIGASITQRDDKVMVREVYKGAPADNAGLMPGDKIIKVGDMEVIGKGTEEVSDLLKGQPDSEVSVKLERGPEGEEIEKNITRQQVQVDNVPFYGMIDDNTGYIKLTNFRQGATREVRESFETMQEDQGMEQVVLDLRGNPGGLLSQAVSMVNLFIPQGETVVSTKGRVDQWEKEYTTQQEAMDTETPIAVLIDGSSASASEIVAGAVQDLDRGVVVGQSSFGKGSVQTTRELSYNTQLKVTTAKYYIPSGRSIEKIDDFVEEEDILELREDRPDEFTTRNGRVVEEADGINPDVITEQEQLDWFVRNLRNKFLIFDFATQYHHENEEIGDPSEFEITTPTFDEFEAFLNERDYQYQEAIEREFESFVEKAHTRDDFEEMKEEVEKIQSSLMTDLNDKLQGNEQVVKDQLSEEIAARFHYESGRVEASFKNDNDVQEARRVLSDIDEYESILAVSE